MVGELRHEEGMQESISELKTLMRAQRIEQNSSDLMKLPGNLGGGITKTVLYGKISGWLESGKDQRGVK